MLETLAHTLTYTLAQKKTNTPSNLRTHMETLKITCSNDPLCVDESTSTNKLAISGEKI